MCCVQHDVTCVPEVYAGSSSSAQGASWVYGCLKFPRHLYHDAFAHAYLTLHCFACHSCVLKHQELCWKLFKVYTVLCRASQINMAAQLRCRSSMPCADGCLSAVCCHLFIPLPCMVAAFLVRSCIHEHWVTTCLFCQQGLLCQSRQHVHASAAH